MRSAEFWAGFLRVAGSARRALSDPERERPLERPINSPLRLLIGGIILALILTAAWYAGRESAGLDAQRVTAELNDLSKQVASNQLALKQEKARTSQLEAALKPSGTGATLARESQLRQQLLQAQAEANEYKTIIERERQADTENSRLVDALTSPGAHLLSLKGAESAANSTAYVLILEKARLVFIGSNLPQLSKDRQYQLWVVRKQDPKFVSAGVFSPDDDKRAMMDFDDSSTLSDIAMIEVTEEPEGGSEAPTGTKLLETGVSAGELGRTTTDPFEGD